MIDPSRVGSLYKVRSTFWAWWRAVQAMRTLVPTRPFALNSSITQSFTAAQGYAKGPRSIPFLPFPPARVKVGRFRDFRNGKIEAGAEGRADFRRRKRDAKSRFSRSETSNGSFSTTRRS